MSSVCRILKLNELYLQNIEQSMQVYRAKEKFSGNAGHSILKLYNVLE